MSLIQQFLKSFRQTDDMEPGLIQKADGTVWLVNPDGSETQLTGSGGEITLDGSSIVDLAQILLRVLNPNVVAGSLPDDALFALDSLGNFYVSGLGPEGDVGQNGSLQWNRSGPDGTFALLALAGAALQIKPSLSQFIGPRWTADTSFEGSPTFSFVTVVHPTTGNANGHVYYAVQDGPGVTGVDEPTWPTDGSNVTDGTVIWSDQGPAFTQATIYAAGCQDTEDGVYPLPNIYEAWANYGSMTPSWGVAGGTGAEFKRALATDPVDDDVPSSAVFEWFDDTVGAPAARFIAKDSDGTPVEGLLAALAPDFAAFINVTKPDLPTIPTPTQIATVLSDLGLVTLT